MKPVDLHDLGTEIDGVWGEMTSQEQAAWNRGTSLILAQREKVKAATPVPLDPLAPEPGGQSSEEIAKEIEAHYDHDQGFLNIDPLSKESK